jgi:hypothetical protein
MTKSKKQFAAQQTQQTQGTSDDFGRSIELAFVNHPWPASRGELLEHAGRHGTFAKSDLARLKQIPHRDYHSVADLMDATRQANSPIAQGAGPVTTPEHNRRAMGDASAKTPMHSASRYDEQSR